jgi:hypothetical protein
MENTKKLPLFFVITQVLIFLSSCTTKQDVRLPLKANPENALIYSWESKIVYDSLLVSDMESLEGWTTQGSIPLSLTEVRSVDGKSSLRISGPVTDTAYFAEAVKRSGSFGGDCNRIIVANLNFREPQDWTSFNRLSMWIYIPEEWDCIKNYFRLVFDCADIETHPLVTPKPWNHLLSLKAGQWNQVFWEISELQRNKVTRFYIIYPVVGDGFGKQGTFTVDIDRLQLQRVDVPRNEGWLTSKNKISFCHSGYTPWQKKIAVASDENINYFKVINEKGETVLEKPVKTEVMNGGIFRIMDFTELNQNGIYHIEAGDIKTRPFPVSETVWRSPVEKAINFFFHQRCGFLIPGVHDVCHQDWQGTYQDEKRVINGGWHDAGDLCQGAHQTGLSVYAMLEMVSQLDQRKNDPEMLSLVVDEAIWGLNWWLKTRFPDGNRIQWSTIRVYSDNKIGTNDDIINTAQNSPWMNFLGSGIEAYASRVLRDKEPDLANECLAAAEEDWRSAMNSLPAGWQSEDSIHFFYNRRMEPLRLASWGAISSIHLYRLKGEAKYAEAAADFGKMVMKFQETSFREGIPVTGYFYNTPEKNSIVHYTHQAFEESPVLALASLCETLPDHPEWIKWYGSLAIHSDYFMKKGAEYSAPYYMLPAAVYSIEELKNSGGFDEFGFRPGTGIDEDTRETLAKQIKEGEMLSGNYYLRRFPVQVHPHRHGSTALQMSEATALALEYKLRNDRQGEQLVTKQVEWILGNNPFSQSIMYGEGYDYSPLFSASSGNIVGALPVGMDCMSNDEPFWYSRNHMTTKEVWVVPTGRFIWSMAYAATPAYISGKIARNSREDIIIINKGSLKTETIRPDTKGEFSAVIQPGEYTIKAGNFKRDMILLSGCSYSVKPDPGNYIDFTVKIDPLFKEKDEVRILLTAEGAGSHDFRILAFNGTGFQSVQTVQLDGTGSKELEWIIQVIDTGKPWVAVIIPDNDLGKKLELTGDFRPQKFSDGI